MHIAAGKVVVQVILSSILPVKTTGYLETLGERNPIL